MIVPVRFVAKNEPGVSPSTSSETQIGCSTIDQLPLKKQHLERVKTTGTRIQAYIQLALD